MGIFFSSKPFLTQRHCHLLFVILTMLSFQVLVAQISSHLAHCQPGLLPHTLLKTILPMLVNGTMEKNSMVKSCSETALVDVLLMRKGPQGQNQALPLLDSGIRDTLNDIISKSLTKLATQPEGKEMVLDDTLLL